jgi:hypothetical protein
MLGQVRVWEREEIGVSQSESQNLSAKLKASEARMNKLVSTYLDGDIPKVVYLKQKDTLMRSSLTLQAEKKDLDHGRNKWVEPLREWILDTKQATFLASTDNFSEIARYVKKVGTNPTVRDKTAHFTCTPPSHCVAMRRGFLASSASSAQPARSVSALTSDEVRFCGG